MDQPEDLSMSGTTKVANLKRKVDEDETCLDLTQNKKKSPEKSSEDAVNLSSRNNVILPVEEEKNTEDIVVEPFKTFEGFKVDGVLSNSADFKRIVVEGSINEEKAVIILDKKPFTDDILQDLFSKKSQLSRTFQNDIYGSYDCVLDPKLSGNVRFT